MRFFDIFPTVSFFILALMITGQSIFLKKKGVPIRSKAKKSAFSKYILYPTFVLILILLISELLKPAFQIPLFILPGWLSNNLVESKFFQMSGVLLITVSLLFMGFTLRNFKTSLRFGMDSYNLGKLITTGVFSISRNPFFVSIELYFLGIVLFFSNAFFISIALLTIVSIHFFILKEEKFLLKNYGEEYKRYMKKVRKYF